jgi:hypothetical protein
MPEDEHIIKIRSEKAVVVKQGVKDGSANVFRIHWKMSSALPETQLPNKTRL